MAPVRDSVLLTAARRGLRGAVPAALLPVLARTLPDRVRAADRRRWRAVPLMPFWRRVLSRPQPAA
ncbi:hypothetical protein [Streptomyces sp. BR123]|uniref:hypothetical protein n=1 Tax=Streptomyces sp. BR123 TaxID=2749828 RepID=UPI0027BA2D2E|nr:hypothetical protein [Streptomyces sp. BR123]